METVTRMLHEWKKLLKLFQLYWLTHINKFSSRKIFNWKNHIIDMSDLTNREQIKVLNDSMLQTLRWKHTIGMNCIW